MSKEKSILMIGTNSIDCFYGLSQEFDKEGVRVIQVHSLQMAKRYLTEQSFAAIMINLEPDGRGGVRGIDVLPSIIDSDKQQDSVCFSVSAESASTLLNANIEHLNTLSIIVGWLPLPIEHQHAARIILDIIQEPKNLALKHRLPR